MPAEPCPWVSRNPLHLPVDRQAGWLAPGRDAKGAPIWVKARTKQGGAPLAGEPAWGPWLAVIWRLCSSLVPLAPSLPACLQRGAFRTIIFVFPLAAASSAAPALITAPLADPWLPGDSLSGRVSLGQGWGLQDTEMRFGVREQSR